MEYVTMDYKENTKNHQGTFIKDFESEKRMYGYGDGDEYCPIKILKLYLAKLNPKCDRFFQRPRTNLKDDGIWYDNVPIGKNKLSSMMKTISTMAKCSETYTNHCLRVGIPESNSHHSTE